ncbi:fungal-specific transcription factor domain-containing protein [Phaeosphaeriaceae sp. PMI808]|nr:fungal-specific transcription factor domain-containing protein [Phaeosphaeriaceae sp. PMI808]
MYLDIPEPELQGYLNKTESYSTSNLGLLSGNVFDHKDLVVDFQLPPLQMLLELVDIFFDKVDHMFPIFHRTSFRLQVYNGLLQSQSPLILYAICCVTARHHPDISVKQRQRVWYEQAKFSYELTKRDPYPGLRTIQAALLLIFHAFTVGDFSSSYLFLGKAWGQAVALNMNRMDVKQQMTLAHGEERTAVQKEEYRRTLWLLFIMDRNYSWPASWPITISEFQFKVDIPVPGSLFQAMDPEVENSSYENMSFTRDLGHLISSATRGKEDLNIFHYICVAHVLLGRVAELVQSLHSTPDTPEYAEECSMLNSHLTTFQLSLPLQAISVLEASISDREHVIWLQAILNNCSILLNFRPSSGVPVTFASSHFVLAVTAARNMAQTIKDTSRISMDSLLSAHIGSCLYAAACVLIIQWRLTSDSRLREDLSLFELVFERMNDVFVFLGLKFKVALEYDLGRSRENLEDLKIRGFQGFLADCSKWMHVKEEAERRGISIDIS